MSDRGTPTDPTRKPRRGLRIALVASLMVNVLVIGMLAGGAMRMQGGESRSPGLPDIRALWRAMPDDARRNLREMAREQGDQGPRESREERRARAAETSARLLAVLRAETFDAAAFTQILQADREAMERRLDAVHAALAVQLSALDHAERQAMAERLEDGRGGRSGGRPSR